MLILNKYLTKEILKFFGILQLTLIILYLGIEFIENIDNLMGKGISLPKALLYFAYKIPFIITQMIPVCILLSVIIMFSLMVKNNELVALKAGGVSIYFLLKPIILIGMSFSILLFFLNETIVPYSSEKANIIWMEKIKASEQVPIQEKNTWFKKNRLIGYITDYIATDQTAYEITLNHFDEEFKLIRRIDAKKGIFSGENWILYDIMEQTLNRNTNTYDISVHDTMTETFDFSPDDLIRVTKKSEEMNYLELSSFIRSIEVEGGDPTIFRVDLYAKTAFPFVCIIMCLIGTVIAVKNKSKEGMPIRIAYGIGVAFVYWTAYSVCISLGYGNSIPPLISAWTANVLFLTFGLLNLINAD